MAGKDLFVFVVIVQFIAVLCFDCTNKTDGSFEVGCKVFVQCISGKSKTVECPGNTVFNSKLKICDAPKNVPEPCGLIKNCSNLKDGSYPDLQQHCASYFTCHAGYYLGHNFCPGGTVYSSELNNCDWKSDVVPPCGNKSSK
ncbi:hypothetical protein LOTGIDRAFT_232054 [Lottia gigantea]|uniref:Chitin-binding type-2 domain-containing protein n=1 Tax=Lottia gigantea TaxID=225164 RepID=V3ZV67_LOTGI|nr:hypothetical protein LOTGIDRAFT_232054 [Lottia gigantea]ESO95368.1 hypothetical protein LOTGIDRAFT_232054 [Lottia gigantea]